MEANLAALKILIVEDQEDVRIVLRDMLGEFGITNILEEQNGRDALNLLEINASVDVILCDWNMPSMSGIEFLKRAREIRKSIPFLMISGRSDQNSVLEARKYGVDGYIRKPFSSVQVESKLRIATRLEKPAGGRR